MAGQKQIEDFFTVKSFAESNSNDSFFVQAMKKRRMELESTSGIIGASGIIGCEKSDNCLDCAQKVCVIMLYRVL